MTTGGVFGVSDARVNYFGLKGELRWAFEKEICWRYNVEESKEVKIQQCRSR